MRNTAYNWPIWTNKFISLKCYKLNSSIKNSNHYQLIAKRSTRNNCNCKGIDLNETDKDINRSRLWFVTGWLKRIAFDNCVGAQNLTGGKKNRIFWASSMICSDTPETSLLMELERCRSMIITIRQQIPRMIPVV